MIAPNKTRVLLVGAGQFAHVSKQVFTRFPAIKVVGVVDTHEKAAQAMARRFRAKWYSSYEDALKHGDFDMVYVNVPSFLHTSFTQAAVEQGKDVFCEKPFATNLKDARRIARLIKQSGVAFDIDLPMREASIYNRLESLINKETFGKFKSMEVWHRATESFIRNDWYWDRKLSGGWFLTTAIHFIDLMTYLLPSEKPETIYAFEKKDD